MQTLPETRLPAHARVWIYTAGRTLSPEESARLMAAGQEFVAGWNAHGVGLMAEFHLLHDLFVVLAVDEQVAQASGCSIDKSVHFIRRMEQELGISLTNRLNIPLWDGNRVTLVPLAQLETLIAQGEVAPGQLFFDHTGVAILDQLQHSWIKSLESSWLNRYLPKSASF